MWAPRGRSRRGCAACLPRRPNVSGAAGSSVRDGRRKDGSKRRLAARKAEKEGEPRPARSKRISRRRVASPTRGRGRAYPRTGIPCTGNVSVGERGRSDCIASPGGCQARQERDADDLAGRLCDGTAAACVACETHHKVALSPRVASSPCRCAGPWTDARSRAAREQAGSVDLTGNATAPPGGGQHRRAAQAVQPVCPPRASHQLRNSE